MLEDFAEGTTSGEPTAGGDGQHKLMESGSIQPKGGACGECPVRRGMPAISADGEEVGRVAAVVVDAAGTSTGLVISRPQMTLGYYHLPLAMIRGVDEGRVLLAIPAKAARSLPRRNEGSTP